MASIAPRIFFCRFGWIVRSTVETGFFTGPEACCAIVAPDGAGAAVWARVETTIVPAKNIVTRMAFIPCLLTFLDCRVQLRRSSFSIQKRHRAYTHTPLASIVYYRCDDFQNAVRYSYPPFPNGAGT